MHGEIGVSQGAGVLSVTLSPVADVLRLAVPDRRGNYSGALLSVQGAVLKPTRFDAWVITKCSVSSRSGWHMEPHRNPKTECAMCACAPCACARRDGVYPLRPGPIGAVAKTPRETDSPAYKVSIRGYTVPRMGKLLATCHRSAPHPPRKNTHAQTHPRSYLFSVSSLLFCNRYCSCATARVRACVYIPDKKNRCLRRPCTHLGFKEKRKINIKISIFYFLYQLVMGDGVEG